MKTINYPLVTEANADDIILLDGAAGTRTMKLADVFNNAPDGIIYKLLNGDPGHSHLLRRSIYRGKNLGSVVTDEQWATIEAGFFDNMFIGDYWKTTGDTWRIVDFDYWRDVGDTNTTKHHVVIMPDTFTNLGGFKMYETVNDTGGYAGSLINTVTMPSVVLPILEDFFGEDHILNHNVIQINSVNANNGAPIGGAWVMEKVGCPSERMMYGSSICTQAQAPGLKIYTCHVEKTQLALFRICDYMINRLRTGCWLRDTGPVAGRFACVSHAGYSDWISGDTSYYIRPVFGIC